VWLSYPAGDSEGAALSAKIIRLSDRRFDAASDLQIDLRTAVDVAIRDLCEIDANWGNPRGLDRLIECREMLRTALATS
jgi:hypothetical protein